MTRPVLDSEFLMRITADLDAPQVLAETPLGTRLVLGLKGGSFEGPRLKGAMVPGGGDWVLMRRDGVAELDIRFTLRTDDGELICMNCAGIADIAPEVRKRIQQGEDMDPASYYFRTTPLFETGAAKYSWLNRLIAVGVGRRTAAGMVTDIFAVR
jgi:hypothetical protein